MSTVELRRPPSGLDEAPEVPCGSREFRRRLPGSAVRHGPVPLTYGALKPAGFAVSMYLLDSAGDFLLALAVPRLGWPSPAAVPGTAAPASGSYAGYVLFEPGVP